MVEGCGGGCVGVVGGAGALGSGANSCGAISGMGVPEILQAVVDRVPPPKDAVEEPTKALIFDSYYDPYRGVIVYLRIMDGTLNKRDRVLMKVRAAQGYKTLVA